MTKNGELAIGRLLQKHTLVATIKAEDIFHKKTPFFSTHDKNIYTNKQFLKKFTCVFSNFNIPDIPFDAICSPLQKCLSLGFDDCN